MPAAVLISAFVSLTITPVLNVYLTGKKAGHGRFYERTEPFFRGMENGYSRLLESFMKVRWMAWVIIAACGIIIWLIMGILQSELAPLEDRSNVRFTVTAPEGTSYTAMQKIADNIANYLYDSVPERDFVFARTPAGGGSNSSQPRIGLSTCKRKRTDTRSKLPMTFRENCRALMMQEYLQRRNKQLL